MTSATSTILLALFPQASGQELPTGDPLQEGLAVEPLDRLIERAEATSSDALVLLKNGKLVFEEYFDRPRGPIEAMSATKSVVSLAIGHLIDAGEIESLDTPVAAFFPQWSEGEKRHVTIRHLLNHTSGLEANRSTEAIYASPDFVAFALESKLTAEPGDSFFYNNRAVNLLAGVVEKASGEQLDAYLEQAIFAPLGIEEYGWTKDGAGHPHAMSGLQIHALDLAKIGQLMLQEGRWGEEQLLSPEWVAASTRPGQELVQSCGLLWWLIPEWQNYVIDEEMVASWRESGVSAESIELVVPMIGKEYGRDEFFEALTKSFADAGGIEAWYDMTWRAGRPDGRAVPGPLLAYAARGYLGQYLVVVPRAQLVAVRQIRGRSHRKQEDGLADFERLVLDLVSD